MKIIYFQGRLGNQMFQYAFFHYLLQKGEEAVWLDCTAPFIRKKWKIELERAFEAVAHNSHKLPYWKARPFYLAGDVLKKVFKKNLQTDREHPAQKAIWWKGYWQNYHYPEAVKDVLLHDFRFPPVTDNENKKTLSMIDATNAVGIHVRRGDYVKPRVRVAFGDICTAEYYREAVEYVRQQTDNPAFFIFSDDPQWVKEHLPIPDAVYVTGNTGLTGFRDLQLMSRCKHQIIANSTFSWWGAWLNQTPGKIVVAPAKWGHNQFKNFSENLIPPSWHRTGQLHPNISLVVEGATEQEIFPLLQQRYDDFELLTNTALPVADKRIKGISQKPAGNHIFKLTKEELPLFKDSGYLEKKLLNYFNTWNKQD
ncbi:MAG: alpha-1,2-fucosyltransferase [Prevotellaceae bacterium]|jgi:hypothetical protein|nr:alpha-1,2-fucosyltransferase [Prevotellaceae bacterium]